MEKENKKKKNNIVAIIFIITTIIAAGLAVYFYLDKEECLETTKVTNEATNKNSTTEKDSNTSTSIQTTLLSFDSSKCINDKTTKYTLATYDNADGLSMKLSQDKKTVTLSINWKLFGPLTNASAYAQTIENTTINNFNQTIEDIYIGGFGQSSTGITLLYLMSDGTVEYTPLMNANSQGTIKSYGKITNVEKIVKFYTADVTDGVTTLAQKSDGTFYDLAPILQSTGKY